MVSSAFLLPIFYCTQQPHRNIISSYFQIELSFGESLPCRRLKFCCFYNADWSSGEVWSGLRTYSGLQSLFGPGNSLILGVLLKAAVMYVHLRLHNMRGSLPVHDLCPIETQPSRLSSSTKQGALQIAGESRRCFKPQPTKPRYCYRGWRLDLALGLDRLSALIYPAWSKPWRGPKLCTYLTIGAHENSPQRSNFLSANDFLIQCQMPVSNKLRSATGFSGRSAKSDKSLPTRRTFPFSQTPPQPDKKPARKPATYAVYELEWENLKKFLLGKWPGHKFERRVVSSPCWTFSQSCLVILTPRRWAITTSSTHLSHWHR